MPKMNDQCPMRQWRWMHPSLPAQLVAPNAIPPVNDRASRCYFVSGIFSVRSLPAPSRTRTSIALALAGNLLKSTTTSS